MTAHPLLTGLDEVRRNWGWFLVLGIALIVLGAVALGAVGLVTLASVLLVGWLLVISGVVEAATAFWARQWSGFFLNLLEGVLYFVVGMLVLRHPAASAAGLTLLLAALFLTTGLFRTAAAVALRYPNWGWCVLDGTVSVLLGVLIWADWPSSADWVIGTFVGIDLIFRGWSWVMFGLAVHRLPHAAHEQEPAAGDAQPRPA